MFGFLYYIIFLKKNVVIGVVELFLFMMDDIIYEVIFKVLIFI